MESNRLWFALVRAPRAFRFIPCPFHQAQDLVSLRLKGHWGYSPPEVNEILGTGGGKAATPREMGLAKA